jgi:uncharacterized protein (DUF1015 family)
MAKIYPFRALRYDTQKVRMEDVVTQPYDKITPAMQQAYYDRSPYNLIRVILGKKEPGDTDAFAPDAASTPQQNVYTRAAETLAAWRSEGILRKEAEPALYGYSQTYVVPGTTIIQERRGFIALGHLYDYAEHVVYRHEQTFPKHKSDRLALFKATRAYCEQIYMLYSDPAFTAEKLIFDAGRPADLQVTDEYNVIHRVWRLADPRLINLIVTAMQDKKLIIADGHHRYETSVTYMKERAAELGIDLGAPEADPPGLEDDQEESPSNAADEPHSLIPKPAFPEAAMMMTFVNMDAPGITILPTHRVVFNLEAHGGEDAWSPVFFIISAEDYFDVQHLPGLHPKTDLELLNATPGVAFMAVTREGNKLLTAKPEAIKAFLAQSHPEISARQAQLDVVQLHTVILEHLLNLSHESIANLTNLRYLRDANEAVQQVYLGQADIAFLTKPVTLEQLREISLSLDVMPQKSTDFYPKLLSGLAIYALD